MIKKILIFLAILFFAIWMLGCVGPIRPIPHALYGNYMMVVPKGTDIGGIKAPEDGFYIGGSRIIIEQESESQPEKQKKLI